MFKIRRKQTTDRQKEYIDRQVKKFPRVVFILFLIYFLLFAAYISWFIYFKSTYGISRVEGTSMQNTLNPEAQNRTDGDDMVYVNHSKDPEMFDIVIIESKNNDDDIYLIKRALGFGGDYITIMQGEDDYYHVYKYDELTNEPVPLDEPYVKSEQDWAMYVSYTLDGGVKYESKFYNTFLSRSSKYQIMEAGGIKYFQVPMREIFYLGDNRAVSSDARERGTAKLSKVQGVAEIILPDANKPGANVLGIKIKAILSFYWQKLTAFFTRS